MSSLSASGSRNWPERGDLLVAARDVAVELVGGGGEDEDGGGGDVAVGLGEPREQQDQEHRDEQDPRDGDDVGEVQLAAHGSRLPATASTSYPTAADGHGAGRAGRGATAAPRHEGAPVDVGRLQGAAPDGDAVGARVPRSTSTSSGRPASACPEAGGHVVDRLAELGGALEGERCRRPGRRCVAAGVPSWASNANTPAAASPASAHEGEELVELVVGLAGEAGDERRAHGDSGQRARARARAGRGTRRRRRRAPCAAARRREACCSGTSTYGHRVARQRLQQRAVDAVRLQVEQAQPDGGGLERRELREEPLEAAPARLRPARRVLADEHQLPRAGAPARRAAPRRISRGRDRLVVALDQRDGAVRAARGRSRPRSSRRLDTGRGAARHRHGGAALRLAPLRPASRVASSAASSGAVSRPHQRSTSGSSAASSSR